LLPIPPSGVVQGFSEAAEHAPNLNGRRLHAIEGRRSYHPGIPGDQEVLDQLAGLGAAYVPARRAMKVDPVISMRAQG
jgi:hypothetical protein